MATPLFFRSDLFIKTALGPAVAGAKVYVCSQPANTVQSMIPGTQNLDPAWTPSPQQQLYSDTNGIVPLPQPVITDGLGHCYFYVTPGTYTVVVMNGGRVQQVYADQSIGLGSGSSSTLTLQTNGVPNTLQTILNLISGTNVTLTPDGSGGVTIAASGGGAGTTLQTNGVNNTLQTLLNLKNGSNITIASDGVGGVTITGTGAAAVTTTNRGGFFGGLVYPFTGTAISSTITAVINQVRGMFFVLPFSVTIGRATVIPNGSFVVDVGIFDISGNKLWSTGAVSYSGTATTTTTASAVTIPPGVYAFCWSSTSAAASFFGPPGTNWQNWVGRTGATSYFTAATAATAGALPSTLGALTAVNNPATLLPAVWFES